MLIILLASVPAAACHQLTVHRDTNAPGNSDIERPPAYPTESASDTQVEGREAPAAEMPDDPGEHWTTINSGIHGGYGGRFGQPQGQRGTGILGVEVSFNRGHSPYSHNGDGFFLYPLQGYGGSLGWSLFQWQGRDLQLGPLYAEAHVFRLFIGAGLGYAVDIDDGHHGPQVSAWLGSLYVRARYMVGDGFGLFFGGQIKIPRLWVESR